VAALALCTQCGPGPGEQPSEPERPEAFGPPTADVHVALHLDEPLAAGQTVVWTAAFQAAWDRMADTLGMPEGIELAAPADPEAVRALNSGRLDAGVVDPRDLTVVAGPATEATLNAIDQVSGRPRPADAPPPSPRDLVAFARLNASVRYEIPFFTAEEPLLFGPAEVPVRAWGLRQEARSESAERMREQVRVHIPADASRAACTQAAVVVLTGAGGKRVVVSGRPPRGTLRDTWQDVSAVIATAPARKFSGADRLTIPRIAIVAGRAYDEIAPAAFSLTEHVLSMARQDLRLVVDERGAEVDAEAVVIVTGSVPLELEFTGPFLVALLASGSDVPFVVAWIGSENGLTPWSDVAGVPLATPETEPFVGNWVLEPELSLDATLNAMQRVLSDGETSGPHLVRSQLAHWFEGRTLDVHISSDGSARVTQNPPTPHETTSDAQLMQDGPRILLDVPRRHDGGIETWTVSRDGDQLKLCIRSRSAVLILSGR